MGEIACSPQVHPLVVAELAVGHVAMVTNDFADVLWRHVLLLCLHKAKLAFLAVAFRLKQLPFPSWRAGRREGGRREGGEGGNRELAGRGGGEGGRKRLKPIPVTLSI